MHSMITTTNKTQGYPLCSESFFEIKSQCCFIQKQRVTFVTLVVYVHNYQFEQNDNQAQDCLRVPTLNR